MLKSDYIKQVIKNKNINVVQLSRKMGISQAGFYLILQQKDCKLSVLLKLAKELSLNPWEMVEGFNDNTLTDNVIQFGTDKIKLLEKLVEMQEENIDLLKAKLKNSNNINEY